MEAGRPRAHGRVTRGVPLRQHGALVVQDGALP